MMHEALDSLYSAKFKTLFTQKKLAFPPQKMLFVALKAEKKLEVWVKEKEEKSWIYLSTYPILKTSGSQGPKRLSGDLQVPEGFYHISQLNPHSNFHLSLRVDYPNSFDKKWAKFEGRKDLGGDIYIHGNNKSLGCLAMGNAAIEEIFYLASSMPRVDISVMIMPYDPKNLPLVATENAAVWVKFLYMQLQMESKKIRGM